jgi:hypothetical protein
VIVQAYISQRLESLEQVVETVEKVLGGAVSAGGIFRAGLKRGWTDGLDRIRGTVAALGSLG